MARHFNAAVRGVFVANPGYALGAAGVPRGAVITSIAGQPVAGLPDFTKAVAALPDGGHAALRYTTLDDPKGTQTRVVRMDRRWFPARECRRDDTTGYWPCTDLPAPPPTPAEEPARTSFAMTGSPIADALAGSLVLVNFDMPFSVAGISERNYHGTGLIVDAERGLVVIDRNTVPVAVGRRQDRLRRVGRAAGPRRVRASPAQPLDRLLRSEAPERHADTHRSPRSARAACRGAGDRRRPRRRHAPALARNL